MHDVFTVGIKRRFFPGFKRYLVTSFNWLNVDRWLSLKIADGSELQIPGVKVKALKVYPDVKIVLEKRKKRAEEDRRILEETLEKQRIHEESVQAGIAEKQRQLEFQLEQQNQRELDLIHEADRQSLAELEQRRRMATPPQTMEQVARERAHDQVRGIIPEPTRPEPEPDPQPATRNERPYLTTTQPAGGLAGSSRGSEMGLYPEGH